MLEISSVEIEIVNKASTTFEEWRDLSDETVKLSNSPMRLIQAKQRRERSEMDDHISDIVLGIVEEAAWKFPEAECISDESRSEKMCGSLGEILIDVCLMCTQLNLDFVEIAGDFNSDKIVHDPNDIYACARTMGLCTAVGQLASAVAVMSINLDFDLVTCRDQIGAALSRVSSAVHWLAFNNDWEPSVIFQMVYSRLYEIKSVVVDQVTHVSRVDDKVQDS